jgi:hypothetical protein
MTRFNWKPWLSLRSGPATADRQARRKARFRPQVAALEDRITPAPTLLTPFDGITFDEDQANGGVGSAYHIPASPTGAASFTHLVSAVNSSIEVHDTNGLELYSDSLENFFAPLNPNGASTISNPKVLYDTFNNRFLVVALETRNVGVNNAANVSRLLVAVSQSSDPSIPGPAGWYYISHSARETPTGFTNDHFLDSAGVGMSLDALYISGNLLRFGPTPQFGRARLYIIPKAGFYDGTATATVRPFDPFTAVGGTPALVPTAINLPQPAQMFGSAPTPTAAPTVDPTGGGTAGYYVRYTFVTGAGEGLASPLSTIFGVALGQIPRVTLPALPAGVTGINLYVSNNTATPGSEQKYNSTPITATTFDLTNAHTPLGAPPTPTSRAFLVSAGWSIGTTDAVRIFRVDNPLAATPTFTQQLISIADIHTGGPLPGAPQAGTSTQIQTGDVRITQAVWKNDRLYAVNTVVPPIGPNATQATVHWYNFSTTNLASIAVVDHGDVGAEDLGAGTATFYPSIAVDGSSNLGIGFSASNAGMFVGSFYTGRLSGDPAGTVQSTGALAIGQDVYVRTLGTGSNQWGRYSGISTHPSGSSFWLFNQFAMAQGTPISGESGRWATRWGNFSFSGPANSPPTLTLGTASASFTENGTAIILDPAATVADPDFGMAGFPDFDTGTLIISFATNGTVDDRLAINSVGSGPGQIEINAMQQIFFGGIWFATFTGGPNGTPLVISFNDQSTPSAIQELLRNITFVNNSENPSALARTLRFQMSDGDGGVSSPVTMTINVTAVNDPPLNTLPPGFSVQQGGSKFVPGISVADLDIGTNNLTVTLSVLHGTLTVSTSVSGGVVPADVTGNGTATVALTASLAKINATLAAIQGLLYVPTPAYNGSDTLTVNTSDNGFTGTPGPLTDMDSLSISVEQNHAPTLDTSFNPMLTPVPEDTVSPSGNTVISLIAPAFFDPDPVALKGIAVVGFTGAANGIWQFSLSGNSAWQAIGTVSDTNALLLRADDRVRFLPNANFVGSATISFRAWDQVVGSPGNKLNPNPNGGDTSFSVETEIATVEVTPVNDAPILNPLISPTLTTISRNNFNATGDTVASMLGGLTDVDAGAVGGIAVIGIGGSGTWQYQIIDNPATPLVDESTGWVPFGLTGLDRARLLRPDSLIRFVPDNGFMGPAPLAFHGWDQSTGNAGSIVNLADINASGGTTAFSSGSETAILNVAKPLTTIKEDTKRPAGNRVASIIGPVLKSLETPIRGIAVIGLTGTANGSWQFSKNGGLSWRAIGTVTDLQARLLRSSDMVRFVPALNFNGTATISYKTWDRSVGSAGAFENTNGPGFSSVSDVSIITVRRVNDRPVLNAQLTPTLPGVLETDLDPAGVAVASLIAGAFTDVDGPAQGIAVTGRFSPGGGRWQFDLNDGLGWRNIPTASVTKALLLRDTDLIRFVPAAGFTGQGRLVFRAWDQARGIPGRRVAATGTAFSKATEFATIDVIDVT